MSDLSTLVHDAVASRPRLRHVQSILVSVDGAVAAEHYFRDRRVDDRSNVHSVTKSVLGSLVGIAIGDGCVDLDTPIADLGIPLDDERKRAITVRALLTMTSGLSADGGYDIDEIGDRGESWVAGPLAAPLIAEPGTEFLYNNGAVHVLSVLLAKKAAMPLAQFARQRLFAPLGIDDFRWPTDPEGNPLGYGHLELRPRDLLALGLLHVRGGRVGAGELIPQSYVRAATCATATGGEPEGVAYGYLWWVTRVGEHECFFAGGFGGQYIVVVPALELVVVTTADVDVWTPQSGNPRRLVDDTIVPALAG